MSTPGFFYRFAPLQHLAICLLMVMPVLVVFVEPFRTDESFFIYISKLHVQLPYNAAGTFLVLKYWFGWITDFEYSLLLLRLLTFLSYIAFTALVYLSFQRLSQNKSASSLFSLAASLALAAWLATNRAFEIRSEFLAILIYALVLFLSLSPMVLRNTPGLILIAVLLFFSTTFSLRLLPLGFGIFFSVFGFRLHQQASNGSPFVRALFLTGGFAALTLLLHVVFFDFINYLKFALSWTSSNSKNLDISEKMLFDLSHQVKPAFAILWMIIFVFFYRVSALLLRSWRLFEYAIVIAPAASFYLFFFFFESQPHRYVHAIGTIALLFSIVMALRCQLVLLPAGLSNRPGKFFIMALIIILLTAIAELAPRYRYVLNLLYAPARVSGFNQALDEMAEPGSLYDQIFYRRTFCSSGQQWAVLISAPTSHPFCGKDAGSFYNTGFNSFADAERFSGILNNRADMLVSSNLHNDVIKHGYSCTAAGKFYSVCRRDAGVGADNADNNLSGQQQ